jgi:Zn finger protein HypA/HybF involved in hydrogenase expression
MKTWTNEDFINAVKSSKKFIEVAQKLGLTNLGSNYKTIKKYIEELKLDTSHFLTREEILKSARKNIRILNDSEMFNINSISRKHIKNTIISKNLIEYKCQICNISTWMNQKLSLHLDHINGVNNDNRLENLRFLCPNCHSLTETYCAKNKKNIKEKNHCLDCKHIIKSKSKYCKKCVKRYKINWPNDGDLLNMVKMYGHKKTGEQLSVSDNAVRKRLHSRNLL